MNATNFELKFNTHRPFSSTKRKGYYLLGLIVMLVGTVGIFMVEFPLSRFYMILLASGVLVFLIAIYGKNLIRESNFISINPQNIAFKNVFQRVIKLEVENLKAIILEKDRVEFVNKEQKRQTYDFSIFSKTEKKTLFAVLNRLKECLS